MLAGRMLATLAGAAALTGCGTATSPPATTSPAPAPPATSSPAPASAPAVLAPGRGAASAAPPPGSCHASGSGLYSFPDPRCTPGARNPAVTQATIGQTICVPGYTKTVRPAERVTEAEKRRSMAAYGDSGPMSRFEYDHLISLELGGAANDTRNLWPEPGASPNPKDAVEDELHRLVCSGQMSLVRAQQIVAGDWVGYAHAQPSAYPATPPASTAPSARLATGASPASRRVHCRDFASHAAAQQWFAAHGGSAGHDVSGLDANHNGVACEELP